MSKTKKCAPKLIHIFKENERFGWSSLAEKNDFESQILALFDNNFVYLPLKLDNPYYHHYENKFTKLV